MSDEWSRVAARIETYGQDMVRFQSGLVACPALGPDNGGQGEAKKAELIKGWLNLLEPDELIEADAPDSRVESGRRPNLIARFKGLRDEGLTPAYDAALMFVADEETGSVTALPEKGLTGSFLTRSIDSWKKTAFWSGKVRL